ncbi:MAG: serine/threonine protein kinase [Lachnospiraceae bacterium]|nr:serine/threonine protein kinase [Lachnospiraceae bacterium]
MINNLLIGKYEIIREIGRGGAGIVYLAYDRHLRQEVAIKQLSWQMAKKAGNLWHEVHILKDMEHSALPIVFDFFSENKNDYMVMELIKGTTLADYINQNGALKEHEAIFLIRQLFSVIKYLHSFKPPIIYCDLKPANIFVTGDMRIKLIDFGTAFMSHNGRCSVKRAGTPGFSAPELFTADDRHETEDIYSLGAVLYYMLAGKEASVGKNGKVQKSRHIDRGIKQIISCCMQIKPQKRYRDIDRLKLALLRFTYRKTNKISRFMKIIIRLFSAVLIFVMLLLLLLLLVFLHSEAYAAASGFTVFIREQEGYKILIKDGAVYHPDKDIIIEIPIDKLPRGTEMSLKVTLENDEWYRESREFLILLDLTQ